MGISHDLVLTMGTESDTKSHLWSCPQAAGLGKVAKAILEVHVTQSQHVPWERLSRLEVGLPQHHSLPAMVMVAEIGAHITATRAREKQAEPETVVAALKVRAVALEGSKIKHKAAGRALQQWIDTHFVSQSASP